MNEPAQIEQAVLQLPAAERERLALLAWESLEVDFNFMADANTDPEGIALARARNEEIESGRSVAITDEEFVRRTSGAR